MQDSSAFQLIAIDQIHESTTNPRQTFEECKLAELAESIRQHGVIQPITIRPNNEGFEIVAGARRFRAAQLAELFSLPARIVELNDTAAMEWQLIENSQREDVHPYEEAQGFQRLLDMPGYDVTTLVEKSGKSASHIYARLSLLQLTATVADAFVRNGITASHANLIARLPQEYQNAAFENCWRKDWQDKEPHLLPAKHLNAWIQSNLYLDLNDAPFDREDTTLNAEAGACRQCPRRSGFNTSLFADVKGDRCLDARCFQSKVNAHIDRQIAARPELVTIETAWRKDALPTSLARHQFRELDISDNSDAEPPCNNTKAAIIVFGRGAGRTVSVCTENNCPVHNERVAARSAPTPPPKMAESVGHETEEQAAERVAEHEERMAKYEAEQEQKGEERKAEFERQQQEIQAEVERRQEERKARANKFEAIIASAPTSFDATQMRFFLSLIVQIDPFSFLEEFAESFAAGKEERTQSDEELVLGALDGTDDAKLSGFALRLVLTDLVEPPMQAQRDILSEAAIVFAPKPKPVPTKGPTKKQTAKPAAKTDSKKGDVNKKAA